MTLFRSFLVVVLGLLLTGCSIGYRHTVHGSTFVRDDGRQAEITGNSNQAHLAATFDFRVVRVLTPYEVGRRQIFVEDEQGNRDVIDLIRERRYWRFDVPLLSVWDFENGGFGGYPGIMRHRDTLDIWATFESDFRERPEWWADLSVVVYRYRKVGFRVFGGLGAIPFDAATPQPNTRFPRLWKGQAPYFGGGAEIILTTGEYMLDLFEWLADMDKRDRKPFRKYGW